MFRDTDAGPDEVLARADAAMYRAKAERRAAHGSTTRSGR
jgi:GGDEF domain-containing protein